MTLQLPDFHAAAADSCQHADLESSDPWSQLSYKTQEGRTMKMTSVNHSPRYGRAVKPPSLKVLRSGAYAGQHINYTPLELEMSRKETEKKRRAADMHGRAMRACRGRGVYWDFNTASDLPATNKFIVTHCFSEFIFHVLGFVCS